MDCSFRERPSHLHVPLHIALEQELHPSAQPGLLVDLAIARLCSGSVIAASMRTYSAVTASNAAVESAACCASLSPAGMPAVMAATSSSSPADTPEHGQAHRLLVWTPVTRSGAEGRIACLPGHRAPRLAIDMA